jgi:hypothetical protein
MQIPWFFDDVGINAGKNTSPHRQLWYGASLTALWRKGWTPAVVLIAEQVEHGDISAVRHLENEDCLFFDDGDGDACRKTSPHH